MGRPFRPVWPSGDTRYAGKVPYSGEPSNSLKPQRSYRIDWPGRSMWATPCRCQQHYACFGRPRGGHAGRTTRLVGSLVCWLVGSLVCWLGWLLLLGACCLLALLSHARRPRRSAASWAAAPGPGQCWGHAAKGGNCAAARRRLPAGLPGPAAFASASVAGCFSREAW